MAEFSSPGYIESVGSTKRKSKEDVSFENLIPSEILASIGEGGIKDLLKRYYEFMNMDEFIYNDNLTFNDIVLNGQAQFRISDPDNSNSEFFQDHNFANSTLLDSSGTAITTVKDSDGNSVPLQNNAGNIKITNGNNLPGTLSNSTTPIGKTYTITGLQDFNGQSVTLTTSIKHFVGPGPSYVINAIEEALDIDANADNYLELMQKEIAQAIPKDLQTNRRQLYKSIVDFYKVRGSKDSVEIFFRLLFDDEVELEYPWDFTLKPSAGNFDTSTNQYLETSGFISEKKIKIHDSNRFQKYSYVIKTGQNVETWENVFNKLVHPAGFIFFGEILILLNLIRSANGDSTRSVTYQYNGQISTGYGGQVFDPPRFIKGRAALDSIDSQNAEEVSRVGATADSTQNGDIFQIIKAYPRTNRFTKSSMPGLQPGVIGVEDIPLLVQLFASTFLPETVAKIHRTAVLSITVGTTAPNVGKITNIEVVRQGYGYSSAPAITISGDGSNATATAVINSEGEVESVTINNAGSGYTQGATSVSIVANSNAGKLSRINSNLISGNKGLLSKDYKRAPNIVLGPPTAVDTDGNLLSSNVQATAKFTLTATGVESVTMNTRGSGYTSIPTVTFSAPGSGTTAQGHAIINAQGQVDGINVFNAGSGYTEAPTITIAGGGGSGATGSVNLVPTKISGTTITNVGNGYVADPRVTLGSSALNEARAQDTLMILILSLNNINRTNNNYFNLKGNSFYNSAKRYNSNQRIDLLGSKTIESTDQTFINSINTSSFIEIN